MRHTKQYMVPPRPRDDMRYMGSAYQSDAKRARTTAGPGDHGSADSKYKTNFPVGAGTFGLVLKASKIMGSDQKDYGTSFYAIKEFKPSKDQELSLTAIREIGLLRELHHENIIKLVEVLVKATDKYSLSIVFEYAEFDLFVCPYFVLRTFALSLVHVCIHQQSIIKKHRDEKTFLPEQMVRSSMWQMLNGLHYIHSNWVIHRDMKPSNVMVMGTDSMCPGQVKIGGLLRSFPSHSHIVCTHHNARQQTLGLRVCSAIHRRHSTKTAWS